MRLSVAMAVCCLSTLGLCVADDVRASIRKGTNIPAEGLAPALKQLAHERGFQLVFQSEIVGSAQTHGAIGEFTSEEALKQLLKGTGLSYRYLDEKTVTIVPLSLPTSGSGEGSGQPSPVPATSGQSQGGLWSNFLVAQATAVPSLSASSVTPQESAAAKSDQIQEIIVTAQKRSERLQDVPISISVLTGKDLDSSSLTSVTDELNLVPGVAAFTGVQGGGTQLSIRGVSAEGPLTFGASPVGYYLDTIPFGLVRSAIEPDTDAYDLQRVEVLKGPQGTLYGAGGEVGVVRVLSNDPDLNDFDVKARASVSETEDGGGTNYRGDTALNLPIVEGKLALRVVLGYESESGWIDDLVATHLNDAQLRTYRVKLLAQPIDNLTVELSSWNSRDTFGAPNTAGEDGVYPGTLPNEAIATDFDAYGLRVNYDLGAFTVSSNTSYLKYSNEGAIDISTLGVPIYFDTALSSDVKSEELLFNSAPNSEWRWTGGFFYRDAHDVFYQPVSVVSLVANDWLDTSKSWAIFGDFGRRIFNDQFEWTLGARYFRDTVSSIDGNSGLGQSGQVFEATTPRAVLTWYPNHDLTAYASFSEGFRSGSPQEPPILVAYPQFETDKPDKLYNYEVGVKGDSMGGRVSFESAIYYMDWRDIQQVLNVVLPSETVSPFGALVNGGTASGVGVDAMLTIRPLDGLELGATLSWNGLSFDAPVYSGRSLLFAKGDRPQDSPEYTGGVFGSYHFPLGSLQGRVSASANYESSMAQNQTGATPTTRLLYTGSDLLFARASIGVTGQQWSASLFGDNLNNERGGILGGNFPNDPIWDTRFRPRTYGIQFEYHH